MNIKAHKENIRGRIKARQNAVQALYQWFITNKNVELFTKNKEEISKLVTELISKNKELISKDNELNFEKMKNVLPQDLIDGMREYFIKNKSS